MRTDPVGQGRIWKTKLRLHKEMRQLTNDTTHSLHELDAEIQEWENWSSPEATSVALSILHSLRQPKVLASHQL